MSPGEGTGATMSDDEEDQDSDTNLYDGSLEGTDSMGFGPLVPTETERSLMERVRQELKHELKQVRASTLDGCLFLTCSSFLIYIVLYRDTKRKLLTLGRRFYAREEQANSQETPLHT